MLVGAEDVSDPALSVARQVQRDFPEARVRILAGARRLGLNPEGAIWSQRWPSVPRTTWS